MTSETLKKEKKGRSIFGLIRRRIEKTFESMSCFHFITVFLFANFGLLFIFIYLLFTPFCIFPMLYFVWMYLDKDTPKKAGRRSKWVRRWPIWRWMAGYFPVGLHKTADLDASKNYIFAFHPHVC